MIKSPYQSQTVEKIKHDFAIIKLSDDVANRKAVPQRNFEIAKQTWESEGFTVPKTKKELADLISQAQQSSFNVEIDKNIFK